MKHFATYLLAAFLGLSQPVLFLPVLSHATVNEVTARNAYTGNGSTTAFTYGFKIFVNTDIEVLVDGITKTLTTHYTVSGVGDSGGGTVTFITAPASATKVTLIRKQKIEQQSDYIANETFSAIAERIEKDLDKSIMQAQQQAEQLTRSLHVNKQSDQVNTEISPTACGDKAVVWNASATGFSCSTIVTTGTITTPISPENGGTGSANTTGYTKAGLAAAGTAGRISRVTDDKKGMWGDSGSARFPLYPVANAAEFAGADAGLKIQAAIDSMPSTGGVVDARAFEGAQVISATIAISKPVELLLGAATYTSSVKPALSFDNDVTIRGLGNVLSYIICSGSGACIQSTNPAVRYYRVRIENLRVSNTSAATAGGIGIDLKNVSHGRLYNVRFDTVETALRIDGTLGAYYNDVYSINVSTCTTGVLIQAATHENHFFGGNLDGCTTGIDIVASGNNQVYAMAIENSTTGARIGNSGSAAQFNKFVGLRLETATTGFNVAANAEDTAIIEPFYSVVTTPVADAGTRTRVYHDRIFTGKYVAGSTGAGDIILPNATGQLRSINAAASDTFRLIEADGSNVIVVGGDGNAISLSGDLLPRSVLFANLGTPSNGRIVYCSDCTVAATCAGSGTGAIAKRLNGAWVCN